MTSGGGGLPGEVGAVFVSVVPSLAGMSGVLAKGAEEHAQQYKKIFVSGIETDMAAQLSRVSEKAGAEAAAKGAAKMQQEFRSRLVAGDFARNIGIDKTGAELGVQLAQATAKGFEATHKFLAEQLIKMGQAQRPTAEKVGRDLGAQISAAAAEGMGATSRLMSEQLLKIAAEQRAIMRQAQLDSLQQSSQMAANQMVAAGQMTAAWKNAYRGMAAAQAEAAATMKISAAEPLGLMAFGLGPEMTAKMKAEFKKSADALLAEQAALGAKLKAGAETFRAPAAVNYTLSGSGMQEALRDLETYKSKQQELFLAGKLNATEQLNYLKQYIPQLKAQHEAVLAAQAAVQTSSLRETFANASRVMTTNIEGANAAKVAGAQRAAQFAEGAATGFSSWGPMLLEKLGGPLAALAPIFKTRGANLAIVTRDAMEAEFRRTSPGNLINTKNVDAAVTEKMAGLGKMAGLAMKGGLIAAGVVAADILIKDIHNVIELAKTEVQQFAKVGSDAAHNLVDGFKSLVDGEMPNLMGSVNVVEEYVKAIWQAPQNLFNTFIDNTIGHLPLIGGAVKSMVGDVEGAFNAIFPLFDEFKSLAGSLVGTFTDIGDQWMEFSRIIAGQTMNLEQMHEYLNIVQEIGASGDVLHFRDVAQVVGELGQRLDGLDHGAGLSSEQLKELATTVAEANELLGNIHINVDGMTAAFNQFQIPAADVNRIMIEFVNLSRMTGTDINELFHDVEAGGPAFSELGYSMEHVGYMMAKINEEFGKPAMQRTMLSLRGMPERFAKMGIDPVEGMKSFMTQLQGLIQSGKMREAFDLTAGTQLMSASAASTFVKIVENGLKQGQTIIGTPDQVQKMIEEASKGESGLNQELGETLEKTKTMKDNFEIISTLLKSVFRPLGDSLYEEFVKAGNSVIEWIKSHKGEIIGWAGEAIHFTGEVVLTAVKGVRDVVATTGPWVAALIQVISHALLSLDLQIKAIFDGLSKVPNWAWKLNPITASMAFSGTDFQRTFKDVSTGLGEAGTGLSGVANFDYRGALGKMDTGLDKATKALEDKFIPSLDKATDAAKRQAEGLAPVNKTIQGFNAPESKTGEPGGTPEVGADVPSAPTGVRPGTPGYVLPTDQPPPSSLPGYSGHAFGGSVGSDGWVRGSYSPGADTVPWYLKPGSYVINRRAAIANAAMLSSIRGSYADGGMVPVMLQPGEIVMPPGGPMRLFNALNFGKGYEPGGDVQPGYETPGQRMLMGLARGVLKGVGVDLPWLGKPQQPQSLGSMLLPSAALTPSGVSLPRNLQYSAIPGAVNAAGRPGGGAEGWRPTVRAVIDQYAARLGIPESAKKAWEDRIVRQIQTESGGDTTAINRIDSNAIAGHPSQGLLQFIPSTYASHNVTGRPFLDPIGQIAAVLDYAPRTADGFPKGGLSNSIGEGHGYAEGGSVGGGGNFSPNPRLRVNDEPLKPPSIWRQIPNFFKQIFGFDKGGCADGTCGDPSCPTCVTEPLRRPGAQFDPRVKIDTSMARPRDVSGPQKWADRFLFNVEQLPLLQPWLHLPRFADGGAVDVHSPLFNAEGPDYYNAAFGVFSPFAKPSSTNYQTSLTPSQESKFRQWVKSANIPFDPNAKISDYDMRGYWLASGGKWGGHDFPDTFKTPYDTTFSKESMYSKADNPFGWMGNNLVDGRSGNVMFNRDLVPGLHDGGCPCPMCTGGPVQGFDPGGFVGPSQIIWYNKQSGQKIGENDNKWTDDSFYADERSSPGQGWGGHTGHVHTTWKSDPLGKPYSQVKAGTTINPGQGGFPDWVYAIGRKFGLAPTTYPGHQEWGGFNHGIDWWPVDPDGKAKRNSDLSDAGYTPQNYSALTQFASTMGTAAVGAPDVAGAPGFSGVGGAMPVGAPGASWSGAHGGGGGSVQLTGFGLPGSGGASGGVPNSPPGIWPGGEPPPQPGGGGGGPGISGAFPLPADPQIRDVWERIAPGFTGRNPYTNLPPGLTPEKAVEFRNHFEKWLDGVRKASENQTKSNKELGTAQDRLTKANNNLTITWDDLQSKIKEHPKESWFIDPNTGQPVMPQDLERANQAYSNAKDEQKAALEGVGSAQQSIRDTDTEAYLKSQELSPGVGGGDKGDKLGSAAEKMGGKLVEGVAQELGFGDVFKAFGGGSAKPPWKWGIWQLAAQSLGLGANWFMNGSNRGTAGDIPPMSIPGLPDATSPGAASPLGPGPAAGLTDLSPSAPVSGASQPDPNKPGYNGPPIPGISTPAAAPIPGVAPPSSGPLKGVVIPPDKPYQGPKDPRSKGLSPYGQGGADLFNAESSDYGDYGPLGVGDVGIAGFGGNSILRQLTNEMPGKLAGMTGPWNSQLTAGAMRPSSPKEAGPGGGGGPAIVFNQHNSGIMTEQQVGDAAHSASLAASRVHTAMVPASLHTG